MSTFLRNSCESSHSIHYSHHHHHHHHHFRISNPLPATISTQTPVTTVPENGVQKPQNNAS